MFLIENTQGQIIAIRGSEENILSELRIGDDVVSNGHSWIKAGVSGKVVGFNRPGTYGMCSEAIQVLWEGRQYKCDMKYKDLDNNRLFEMNRARTPVTV